MPSKTPGQSELFASRAEAPEWKAAADFITIHIDGGARGNPGPAGYGAVFTDANGAVLLELSEHLGIRTNNYAEYSGLIAALEKAVGQGHRQIRVRSDSELMVRQMTGRYKVRSPELKPLYEKARALSRKFESFEIEHVRREKNRAADRLANEAMDRGR